MTLRLVSAADTLSGRVALAKSILANAAGHEQRAVREALAALDGADIDQLLHEREETND